jgi:class 3 adenylate cyclase
LPVGEDGVELAGEVVEDQYAAWADALSVGADEWAGRMLMTAGAPITVAIDDTSFRRRGRDSAATSPKRLLRGRALLARGRQGIDQVP